MKTRLLLFCLLIPIALSASNEWPGFRGSERDGIAAGSFASGAGGLAVAWRSTIGSGYPSLAIAGGRAITMFSDGTNDVAASFDARTGAEQWRYTIAPTYKGHDGSHDGPIATPVISGNHVFGFGPRGHLFALDVATGKPVWTKNVAEELGGKKPWYGFSSSPIVAEGVLIVEIGSEGGKSIAGFDAASGKLKWTMGTDAVSYQSPVIARFKDRAYVVGIGDEKVYGIDPVKGVAAWEFKHEGQANPMAAGTLTPIPVGDGRLFMKTKNDTSSMIQLVEKDGKIQAETVWTAPVLKSSYSIPVYHDGHLYGYNGRVLTCVNTEKGEVMWRSREPGDGFPIIVGNKLVIQAKGGSLHVADASPLGWKEQARLDLFAQPSWSQPGFADGAIYARSLKEIARVEWRGDASNVAKEKTEPSSTTFAQFLKNVEAEQDKKAAVEKFLASVSSFPLIEWPDHVYFLYNGEAEDMAIMGDMVGARHEVPMNRVAGTNLFWYHIQLEPDARIAYRFIRNFEEDVMDPRNQKKMTHMRNQQMSWFSMPAWNEAGYLKEAPAERRGKIESKEFKATTTPGTVKFDVYLPEGYAAGDKRYPVAYILDGVNARSEGMLTNALDNKIGQGLEPVIAVFMTEVKFTKEFNDPNNPYEETDAATTVLAQEIVKYIDSNYRTITDRTSRLCIGHGGEGFNAFYAVFVNPEIFGAVGAQSLFMLDSDEQVLEAKMKTFEELPLRIYLDWGSYDLHAVREGWSMIRMNREFDALLRKRGYNPAGGEVHDGFGWISWRNRTDRLLAALL